MSSHIANALEIFSSMGFTRVPQSSIFFTDTIVIDIFAVKAFNLRVNRAVGKMNLSLSKRISKYSDLLNRGFNKRFNLYIDYNFN